MSNRVRMRKPAWLWCSLSLLGVLSLLSAVVPVAAQADVDSWEVDLPTAATPGTTLIITGRTALGCLDGTAEVGWDPDFNQNIIGDGRSGGQVGISVPTGDFSVELPIPSSARGGTLYGTCQWGRTEQYIYTANSLNTDGSPTSGAGQGDEAPTDPDPDADADEDSEGSEEPVLTDDLFQFSINRGTAALAAGDDQASGWPVGAESDGSFVLAAGPDDLTAMVPASDDVQAIRVPRGAGCSVSTCLWGYFAIPYFGCNQTVVVTNFGRSRYGSMTGYGYVRKGTADYVTARPLFYQDGVLIKTGSWEKKSFFNQIGQPWEAWYGLKIHQQFANPQSTYQVAFQARWYRDLPLRRDRIIAQTGRVAAIPYTCTAGP